MVAGGKRMLGRLYVIVDAGVLRAKGMSVEAMAAELAGAGVRVVQYRNKDGEPNEVLAGAASLKVGMGEGCLLVMNDRMDLAMLAGFGGVHMGQGDLGVEDVREVVGEGIGNRDEGIAGQDELVAGKAQGGRASLDTPPYRDETAKGWGTRFVVGVSTHNEEQVREADAGGADYVAVGPVFATGTKADAAEVVGLEGVRRARSLTTKPLVAIGGITLGNCRSVVEAGADLVAVISGVFVEGRSVGETVRDFLEVLR